MAFIELDVRTAYVVHGFDDHHREIRETVDEPDFMTKLVAIERIQSISERYILVTGSHGRVMYWEYRGEMARVKETLAGAGHLLTR
ncbi:hypothetical protein [Halomonas koreensis]|uniref:Uncharacterized protein n=1 Tax=Halomonas koreensis TaxID=245385 RepID=A0ABU1FZN0_9GAMM|nr:hypothetical protein [Halomonas koreensis]MDR5866117.1 hypothetical protein [Halomonas koreensis]